MTLKRRTPLRRTGRLKRSPMKRKNTERAAKRRAEAFGEQAELCRRLMCFACVAEKNPQYRAPEKWGAHIVRDALRPDGERLFGFSWLSDPHHVPTRGAGGVDKDTVPLCRYHHREWHDIGEQSFDAKYGVNLRAVAKAIHDELTAHRNVAQGMEQSE